MVESKGDGDVGMVEVLVSELDQIRDQVKHLTEQVLLSRSIMGTALFVDGRDPPETLEALTRLLVSAHDRERDQREAAFELLASVRRFVSGEAHGCSPDLARQIEALLTAQPFNPDDPG